MTTLLIAVGAFVGYVIAYHTYGRWLSKKIFNLDPDAVVPSVALNDDRDYVPTAKSVVFGHHFTSIAGTGPIVGPAIAVMWGWVPALLWVFLGSILIGAVHDFGSLVVSLRNRGMTVGDIAGRVLNPRVRLLFLLVLFMALTIVLAIFGLVIAAVFRQYPAAIFPTVVQIPIAVAIGVWLHRKGVALLVPSILALAIMYLTVIFGNAGALGGLNLWMASWPTIVWVVVLLIYSYVASVLPVWMLLQPRDYINSLQLLTALGLIVVGLAVAAAVGGAPPVAGATRPVLEMAAPAIRWNPAGAPLLIPFLFITIACGAISGFHCLVSSGTTSKQLKCETDAQFVGYGSMLTEGFLATLVILACVGGLGLGISPPLKGVADHRGELLAVVHPDEGNAQALLKTEDGIRMTPLQNGNADAEFLLGGQTLKLRPDGNYAPTPQQHDVLASGRPAASGEFDRTTGVWVGSGFQPVMIDRTAYHSRYFSWQAAGGLSAKVGAFVDGAANFLKSMGIPGGVAIALMGVLVASFAGTTLDTACRLQRYVIQELASTFAPRVSRIALAAGDDDVDDRLAGANHNSHALNPFVWLSNRHGATIFAVVLASAIAALPRPGAEWTLATAGTGGLILWPLFGATNQLLGGLAFLVVTFYLWRRGLPIWFLVLPMIFMLIMPAAAMTIEIPRWIASDNPNW
ncbi:MAG: carbon starvation protein A, partial [Planctomycetaceae bacterium]